MSEEILVNYDEFSKAITSISNIVSSFESIQSNITNVNNSLKESWHGKIWISNILRFWRY